MSIWKKLFGGKPQKQDQQLATDIQRVQNDEDFPLYPVLKPGDWIGVGAGIPHRVLLSDEQDLKLVLAYAFDTPSSFVFIGPQHLQNRSLKDVHNEAMKNLEAFESKLEVIDVNGLEMITASGGSVSSEKILDVAFMKKAQAMLNASSLLVSIPRRTCLYITANAGSIPAMEKFTLMHSFTFNDDSFENAPIVDMIFVVKDGNLEDAYIPPAKSA